MNATHLLPNLPRHSQPARPHKRIDYTHENHLDRELRKLRRLSSEVGEACSIWLANRGIFSRTWERSSQRDARLETVALDFQLSNDL